MIHGLDNSTGGSPQEGKFWTSLQYGRLTSYPGNRTGLVPEFLFLKIFYFYKSLFFIFYFIKIFSKTLIS